MATDKYAGMNTAITGARRWAAITPGAGLLAEIPKALWVNQACDLTVAGNDDVSEVFTVAGAGPVDLQPTKVTAISAGTVLGLFD